LAVTAHSGTMTNEDEFFHSEKGVRFDSGSRLVRFGAIHNKQLINISDSQEVNLRHL